MRFGTGLLVWLCVLVACAPAHGAAGDLDTSFAGDGRVDFPAAGPFVARGVALDRQGRIVVAGYSCEPDPRSGDGTCLADGNSSFRLARLTPDGGLDPEFGANGFVTTPVGAGRSQALDVVVLPTGGIVAAGVATSAGTDVFALVKYTDDGAVDRSFGAGGRVLQPVGIDYAAAADVTTGPGGTLIAAGQAVDGAGRPRTAVARFTPAGRLDTSFGAGGSAIGGPGNYGYGLGVAVSGDGSVVSAGIAGDSVEPATYRFGLARFTASGQPATAFGSGGSAEYRLGTTSSFANAVITSAAGTSVAAGAATAADGRQAMAIVRSTAAGGLEPRFGSGGSVLVSMLQGAVASDLVADLDGRVTAVGHAVDGTRYSFAEARLLQNGSLDRTFGDGGVATIRWERYPVARATAGAMQANGRLVTVGVACAAGGSGTRCTGGTGVLVVARQLGDDQGGTPPSSRDTDPPAVRVKALPRRVSRRTLRRRGLPVRVRLSEVARLRVRLVGHEPGGPRMRTLARASRPTPSSTFRLRLKVRAAKGPAKLRVRATDAAGNARLRTFTIRVR